MLLKNVYPHLVVVMLIYRVHYLLWLNFGDDDDDRNVLLMYLLSLYLHVLVLNEVLILEEYEITIGKKIYIWLFVLIKELLV
jgi:hypothetical protein